MTKCRNCGEEIRRIEPGEGYDLREYRWTHAAGGLLCDLGPPHAEPAVSGVTAGSVVNGGGTGRPWLAIGTGGTGGPTVIGGGGSVGPVTITGSSGTYVPPEPVRLSPEAEHLALYCTGSHCGSLRHLKGRTLTSADPEPPAGTIVRDACGLTWERDWDGGNACWSHPDGGGDHESWTKIAGNYGPVTVLEIPED